MNKWKSLINFTKTITSRWARAEAIKRNKEIRELTKCMNNLDMDNETFIELTEEFNSFEIEKYKIKTELYKFKIKFDNKNLLKFKAQMNTANRTMKKLIIENSKGYAPTVLGPVLGPIKVLGPVLGPTKVLGPVPGPTIVLGPVLGPTKVLGPVLGPTKVLGPVLGLLFLS